MSEYSKEAEILQNAIRKDEAMQSGNYSDEVVKRAIVHAREDIVLIVSHISNLNIQLDHLKKTNKYIFLAMCFLIGAVVVKFYK